MFLEISKQRVKQPILSRHETPFEKHLKNKKIIDSSEESFEIWLVLVMRGSEKIGELPFLRENEAKYFARLFQIWKRKGQGICLVDIDGFVHQAVCTQEWYDRRCHSGYMFDEFGDFSEWMIS